eukprot:TRINITY_DN9916_c0_g1_i2.p1 TRINITY_DN9916_c0_g1~~TRINITY_DN9916_c0_g1_i2.p1  ORF type:complete len:136 (+),score=53.29 TRINITY_DN9916_c0_g1_i2:54-461(+)
MSTGVTLDDACIEAFNAMKLKKKYRWISFQIVDKKVIKIDKVEEDRSKTYKDFYPAEFTNEARYFAFDMEYTLEDGGERSKLLFFTWNPDSGKVQNKMLYAGSSDAIRKKFEGVTLIQANDLGDAAEEIVMAKCK